MTDVDAPHRRFSDPRIDKIDRELGALAQNVTGLQTSVALAVQGSGFVTETTKRIESGQVAMAEDLRRLTEAMAASASDPAASPAGRVVMARLAEHETDIGELKNWRIAFTSEVTGTVRTFKFLVSVLSVVATVLSVLTFVDRVA